MDTTHSVLAPSCEMGVVGGAYIPPVWPHPHMCQQCSPPERPHWHCSQSLGLVHWTQTTMAEGTVSHLPHPHLKSPCPSGGQLFKYLCKVMGYLGGRTGVVVGDHIMPQDLQMTLCIHIPPPSTAHCTPFYSDHTPSPPHTHPPV